MGMALFLEFRSALVTLTFGRAIFNNPVMALDLWTDLLADFLENL